MASFQVSTPAPFNFSQPEEWTKWIKRFERFRQALELGKKAGERQVNTLLYTMGESAEDIFQSFNLSEEDTKNYDVVVERFQRHFVSRRNIIFERAKFNSRKQEDGETADSFITSLYGLAEHCAFGQLHDELIRDRIVVGIRDTDLSEKLQLDPDLNLQKAVNAVRQRETVKKQQATLRGMTTPMEGTIDAVHKTKQSHIRQNAASRRESRDHGQGTPQHKRKSSATPSTNKKLCRRCGKAPNHPRQQCPAREATCHNCSKKGHFKSVCRSRNAVDDISDEEEFIFLDTVSLEIAAVNGGTKPWIIGIHLNGNPIEFKIDTGADVTVIPATAYRESRDNKLQPAGKVLRGPSQHTLTVLGKFHGTLQSANATALQDIYVVKGLQKALLGRPAIEALGIAVRVDQILDNKATVKAKFP